LRASCESDLAREYPITTVCKWIGNTVAIAARHYVQVTDDDFRRASGEQKKVAQNPAQLESVLHGNSPKQEIKNPVFTEKHGALPLCTAVQMEAAGIEPASRDISM